MRLRHKRQMFRLHAMRNTILGGDGDGDGDGGGGDPGTGGGGDGGDGPVLLSALLGDSELAKDPALQNYISGSVEDLAKGYLSSQSMVGADPKSVIKLPTGTGDEHAAAWGEVYAKLGRPDDAKGYELPEALAAKREDLQLSDELVGDFAGAAHKLGLTKAQFSGVMEHYGTLMEGGAAEVAAAEQAKAEAQDAMVASLKTEWGAEYDSNVGLALDGINQLGEGDDAKAFVDMLEETGLGDNPVLIKLFAKVGELVQEDNGGGNSGDTGDTSSFNRQMTPDSAQSEIQKLMGDPDFSAKWLNESEPGHAEAVARLERLNRFAYPQQKAS